MLLCGFELLALGTILGGGALVKSSKDREGESGGPSSPQSQPYTYSQQPVYPMPQQYEGRRAEERGQGEAVLRSPNGHHFYAVASYSGMNMQMLVDTGATHCVIGDETMRWLSGKIDYSRQGSFGSIDGRTVQGSIFTFPYLTVGDVTIPEVSCVHMPGTDANVLGASFLMRCHVEMHGNQMILRG